MMAAQRDKDKKKKDTENPPKKAGKDPAVPAVARDDDDDDEEDLEASVNGPRNHCTNNFRLWRGIPQQVKIGL